MEDCPGVPHARRSGEVGGLMLKFHRLCVCVHVFMCAKVVMRRKGVPGSRNARAQDHA